LHNRFNLLSSFRSEVRKFVIDALLSRTSPTSEHRRDALLMLADLCALDNADRQQVDRCCEKRVVI
jgi:hypothetical protein